MTATETEREAPTTWPDLAEGLYGFLTGRGATIAYFDQLEIMVPRTASDDAPGAKWRLNGTLRIHTTENGGQ